MRKKEMARRIEELENEVWGIKHPMGEIYDTFFPDKFGRLIRKNMYRYKYNEPPILISTSDSLESQSVLEIRKIENNSVYFLQYFEDAKTTNLFYYVVNTKTKKVVRTNEKWQKIIQY